jgi:O-antigen ligase
MKGTGTKIKNMLNKLMNEWRPSIIFTLLVIMMGSLFISRALLSASMIAFIASSFFHPGIKQHLRDFFSSPLLWGMSLLFFLPLFSGLWSADKQAWLGIIRTKLPLFFLPLAFAGPFSFSKKEWERLAFVFLAVITIATIWSMFHYVINMREVQEGYLRAKSMITPLENDHVRFSWIVSVAILLAGWLWVIDRRSGKWIFWLLPGVAVWLVLFLHILAARTGLLSFYLSIFITTLWLIFFQRPGKLLFGQKKKLLKLTTLILLFILLPLAAYFVLPTFHNRVKYFLYDRSYFKDAHYLPGTNDAVRVISLKGGWSIMNEHPITGVGFGDVLKETKKWYESDYPQMAEPDKIYPSSEWLIYGAACGWPGFLVFTCLMILPFFIPVKDKLPWWLLNLTAAFSLLFDIGLEVQFGLFVYCFIVLWWWKWLKPQKV